MTLNESNIKGSLNSAEIKSTIFQILLAVSKFCQEHHIRYFLAFGSLIGSVRHQGFIPWDDDIDIWMPRRDYNRFIIEFNHPIYKFRCMEKEEHFPLCFGKVCDPRYLAMDNFGKDFGLYVDVFPMDGLPDDNYEISRHIKKIRRIEKLWSNQVISSNMTMSRKIPVIKNAKILVAKVLKPLLGPQRIISLYLKTCQKFDWDTSVKIIDYCTNVILNKSDFNSSIIGQFEGYSFPIPVGYDNILRSYYGDYMKLPPENERISHGITAYRKS